MLARAPSVGSQCVKAPPGGAMFPVKRQRGGDWGQVNHHEMSRDLLFHLFRDDYKVCIKYHPNKRTFHVSIFLRTLVFTLV